MKKQRKTSSKIIPKTKACRIPLDQLKKLEKVGGGYWRRGLTITLSTYEKFERDPSEVLIREIDLFGSLVHSHLPENHLEHYVESGLPMLLRKFAKTGQVDKDILWSKRPEKAIDSFKEKEEVE